MTRTLSRLAIVGIALLVVASAVPLPPPVSTAAAAEHSFVVEHGDDCYEVSPLRGDEDAVSFYDYRTTSGSPAWYSSHMPGHLTRDDASRLFLYEGPDGVSLVIVHNENGGDGNGSAATFRFEGLPSGGEWVVEDDSYPGQDDRFARDRIDWSWAGRRTDGAVFRGLDRDGTEITIEAAFDEDAALYEQPVDRSGNVDAWQFLTGGLDDPSAVALDAGAPVTVRTGHCDPDDTAPSAALSAEDGVVGSPVTFDAGDSSDDRTVAEYRWDFDGDGTVDRNTTDPTIQHTYDAAGTYEATVTVVDEAGNEDSATASVTVDADDPPEAAFRADGSAVQGVPVSFNATGSADDRGVAEYRWDFDGDGEVDETTGDATISHTYEETGDREVGLTVVDTAGQNASTTRTVSVGADEPPEPAFRVESPATPVEGEEVVFNASASSDDTGIAEYRWTFAGEETKTGERVAHTFDGNGTFTVALEVVDEGGNNATRTTNVTVRGPDETPPNAALGANTTSVAANDPVRFDASDSDDERSRIEEYRWDFDGDGEPERTTDDATVTYAYDAAGTYDATVTVVDAGGNEDSANVTVEVRERDATDPTARLSVDPNETKTGDEVQFDASGSSDDENGTGIEEYRWDFDGDDAVDETTGGPTVTHSYDSPATYEASVTVADADGNTDSATVSVRVEQNEQPKRDRGDGGSSGGSIGGAGGGGGGGGGSSGPPPVVTRTEKAGPNAGLVDVRNARSGKAVEADLPESEAAARTGVRFRQVRVDLGSDDPHFAVETSRPADGATAAALPAEVSLGSLSVGAKYLRAGQVAGVTYEVAVERSRLADAGLAPADLTAYRRAGGEWTAVNTTVASRGRTVVLRVRTDGFGPVALGGDRSVTVADARLDATRVAADEPVSVTATLRNEGESPVTYRANLTADGEVVASKTVEVPAGATANVTVERRLSPGAHRIALDATPVGNVTVAEPGPDIGVAEVSLNDSSIRAGGQVEITATVRNDGSEPGEREVALTLFGEQIATKTVRVPAHEAKRVTFVRSVNAAGNYTATVGNASASLAVEPTESRDGDSPAPGVPGFGVGATVAALVAGLLLVRTRE
ncbi:PKD domain-containing protein [Halorussus sp. AFM4]|uniref:COG1470 family protein n=1 Tax=Halorussus sp. AFM4 TaxID=3421651 RepID=UPI003EBC50ED